MIFENPIDGFIAFSQAFPVWRLVQITDNVFNLMYNPISQQTMADFNPDNTTLQIKGGTTVPFFLTQVSSVSLVSGILLFTIAGIKYKCVGVTGVASILAQPGI